MDTPLSDADIAALLAVRKVVMFESGERAKGKHLEREFQLQAADGTPFVLFTRQNTKLADDFTVGLRWVGPDGESVILVRYNGASHLHINHIEKQRFLDEFHVHKATERYMAAGLDDEGYAEPTNRYSTMREAFAQLVIDFNIQGARLPPEQLPLA